MTKFSSTILASFVFLEAMSIYQSQPTILAQSHEFSSVAFLNGTWEGSYICGEELTNLRLVIEAESATNIEAIFSFYEDNINESLPDGVFRMEGALEVFDPPSIPNILQLRATNWVNQPSGYETVDLIGDVYPSQEKITGNVIGPNCTQFELIKQEF